MQIFISLNNTIKRYTLFVMPPMKHFVTLNHRCLMTFLKRRMRNKFLKEFPIRKYAEKHSTLRGLRYPWDMCWTHIFLHTIRKIYQGIIFFSFPWKFKITWYMYVTEITSHDASVYCDLHRVKKCRICL